METKTDVKWYNTTTVKMGAVAFMVLLLMAPLAMILNIIEEREKQSVSVQHEMADQWGGEQLLLGPMINVPVTVTSGSSNAETSERRWLHIMPDELSIKGEMKTELRFRGIYNSLLYISKMRIEGSFSTDEINRDNISKIHWEEALLGMGITDMRGIRGEVAVLVDNKPLKVEPAQKSNDMEMAGLSAPLKTDLNLQSGTHSFVVELELAGSQKFSVVPVGRTSRIALSSVWRTPAFIGSHLPQKRIVNEKGFKAEWDVTYLNRDIPGQWLGKAPDVAKQNLGVEFYSPVNHYQKSMRSAKYGILFIVLTLLVFIYFELTGKNKIHLFQYFLVGLALVLFFSILTALSEQVGFSIAYILASLATITLITGYTHAVLSSRRSTLTVAILLVALYSFLFILLQLNEYAFLAGNAGLFIILGIVMKASLKIKQEE